MILGLAYLAHRVAGGACHIRAGSVAGYLVHIVRSLRLTRMQVVNLKEVENATGAKQHPCVRLLAAYLRAPGR